VRGDLPGFGGAETASRADASGTSAVQRNKTMFITVFDRRGEVRHSLTAVSSTKNHLSPNFTEAV
jgi:hypothetical protein